MKIKTSDLIGPALDWAVMKCEGEPYEACAGRNGIGMEFDATRPSTDWAQGGPIIERERISVYAQEPCTGGWFAATSSMPEAVFVSPTPLIAAMRCYVASKLGDEVDVPEELTD